ncbi:MAG: hypothetical protein PHW37_01690 [Acholeplasmataceae bacterium]|nr:hypothetical protein [Acholeplasmataceae bacterium]
MIRNKKLVIFYFFIRIAMLLLLIASVLGIFINSDSADISRSIFVAFQSVVLILLSFGPSFVEKKLKLQIPDFMESIFLFFIIAALLFGEVAEFFVRFTWWDDLLHTTSGFLIAITGFSIINSAIKNPKSVISISPIFVSLFIFCFSISIEVIWELFEYTIDSLFSTSNMLRTVDSISQIPYQGLTAIKDTMHDLILTVFSALFISIIGFFDAKNDYKIFNKWIISK